MADRLRDQMRLANLLVDWIKTGKRFELTAPMVMPVICFRFVGGDAVKLDALNSKIVEKINASGRAYLTQTKLRGHTTIRIGLGNVLTTEQHLRNVWELIQTVANQVSD